MRRTASGRDLERASRCRGVTLIELLIVMTIIAILVMLSFPAIQYSREMSRRVSCQSNLRQLGVAVAQYLDVCRVAPSPAPSGRIGGWAIAILPYMEESNLADHLSGYPPLDSPSHQPWAALRPEIMTCPSREDPWGSGAPPSHYVASFTREAHAKHWWSIYESREGSLTPWTASPESGAGAPGPHHGGHNYISGRGPHANAVEFEPK
jgi:prepilin-type N-terminal cleavage/methylation domain-containing protein